MLPLGIQAGMTRFSLMWQGSPDIRSSKDLKQQQTNQSCQQALFLDSLVYIVLFYLKFTLHIRIIFDASNKFKDRGSGSYKIKSPTESRIPIGNFRQIKTVKIPSLIPALNSNPQIHKKTRI